MCLTTKTAVSHCFTKIGYETRSDGHWIHELQMLIQPMFSLTLLGSMIARKTRQAYMKTEEGHKKP